MMDDCPCKNCERKGCGAYHDQCEAYLAYRAKMAEEHERKRTEYEENYIPTTGLNRWRKYRR